MCEKCCRCTDSDEGANSDIENFLAHSTPEQAWALHFVSEGSVRNRIETAIAALIAQGNEALADEFPALASGNQPSGDRG
jgi:hypothetical protein